jgi:hypothetical protein
VSTSSGHHDGGLRADSLDDVADQDRLGGDPVA